MLQEADELTKGMSKAEYKQYSDCRAASFHHKKGTFLVAPFSAGLIF
jgi:hypothetical protein